MWIKLNLENPVILVDFEILEQSIWGHMNEIVELPFKSYVLPSYLTEDAVKLVLKKLPSFSFINFHLLIVYLICLSSRD